MLGKLIKHEFKATAKLLLPLLAAVLALMGGFQVIFLVVKLLTGRNDSHPLVAVLFALFAVLRPLPPDCHAEIEMQVGIGKRQHHKKR